MEKKKFVIVGNCQARPLAMAFERLSDEIEVTAIAVVHLLKSDQFEEYRQYFDEADYIVAQLVADNYPCDFVRTGFLRNSYGDKVVSIVNLYFTGYTPDWFYIRIPGKGPLRGPMGDYHNKTIVESWRNGLPIDHAASLILNNDYNEKYRHDIEISLDMLLNRERDADVKIVDYIKSNFSSERLFFTFNHPSATLVVEYAKRVIRTIGLRYNSCVIDLDGNEPLSKFRPLVNPASGLPRGEAEEIQGVEFFIDNHQVVIKRENKIYSPYELARSFYLIYDRFDKYVTEHLVR